MSCGCNRRIYYVRAARQYPRLQSLSLYVDRGKIHDWVADSRVRFLLDIDGTVVLRGIQRSPRGQDQAACAHGGVAARSRQILSAFWTNLADSSPGLRDKRHDTGLDRDGGVVCRL